MVVKEVIQILTHDEHVEQFFVNDLKPLDRRACLGILDSENEIDSLVRPGHARIQREFQRIFHRIGNAQHQTSFRTGGTCRSLRSARRDASGRHNRGGGGAPGVVGATVCATTIAARRRAAGESRPLHVSLLPFGFDGLDPDLLQDFGLLCGSVSLPGGNRLALRM